ncbi:MAG: SMP-30/gluconolactonase/LRE family protein [Pseudomonadota bacterium]
MKSEIYDSRRCILGEGPLWHPERDQLFWFDIIGKKLLTVEAGAAKEWQFDECVSAAGWIDRETLLVASETGLYRFDIASGQSSLVIELEADNPATRSNDGRADPWGGFWIGTMGKVLEANAGSIYRFINGKVERLFSDITIPNAICFSPDRQFAYFTDTLTRLIMRQKLDEEGWPIGEADKFIDLRSQELNPDGAVVDSEGYLWNAQWGARRIARYTPQGRFDHAIEFPALQVSCPAFGGNNHSTLFVTSAAEGLTSPSAEDGQSFVVETDFAGTPEYAVGVS